MAGISLRSLLNYKNAGTVTAWKIQDANRIRYDWRKVLKQLGKTKQTTATTAKASPTAPIAPASPTAPTAPALNDAPTEVKQALETSVQAPAEAKPLQVASAEAVEQTTVESWVDYAATVRDENTTRLHKIFAEQRADFLKTPKERERDARKAKAGVLPQWQDPFS